MPIYTTIENMLPELSKNERKVADHILKYPNDIRRLSGDGIAELCGVSRSAVIRFCHKLGYSGYLEFRNAFTSEPLPKKENEEDHSYNSDAMKIYGNCIRQIDQNYDPKVIETVADQILHANKVVSFGILHSALSAEQFSFRLNRQLIDCHYISDSSIMDNYTSILKAGDVVVIFSISGQKQYLDYIRYFRQNRVRIVLITGNPQASIVKYCDHILVCPSAVHSKTTYLLDDAICFFLMIELLIEAINKKMNNEMKLLEIKEEEHD